MDIRTECSRWNRDVQRFLWEKKFVEILDLVWAGLGIKKKSTVELDSISFKSCLSKAVHLCISLAEVNC